jgi:hypothetical protein
MEKISCKLSYLGVNLVINHKTPYIGHFVVKEEKGGKTYKK